MKKSVILIDSSKKIFRLHLRVLSELYDIFYSLIIAQDYEFEPDLSDMKNLSIVNYIVRLNLRTGSPFDQYLLKSKKVIKYIVKRGRKLSCQRL